MQAQTLGPPGGVRAIPSVARLVGTALLIGAMSWSALMLNASSGGITILWPSNGLLLGVLLCVPRRQWAAYLTVGYLVDFAINCLVSIPSWTAAYLSACNMLEVAIAAFLLYRTIAPRPDLTRRKQLVSLLLYGVVLSSAVAAFLASFALKGLHSEPLLPSFLLWFTADALGMATMAPLYLSFKRRQPFAGRSWQEIAGLLSLLCVATVYVFWQTQYPLLYLLFPFLLLLGVRTGLAGSSLGLLAVSVVGGFFTITGHGPLVLVPGTTQATRILQFQLFIAVSMLVLYIVELIFAESKRLQQSLHASENRFRLMAEVSRDVIVLMDLDGRRRYVSPAVVDILGWNPDEMVGGSFPQIVHPDDIGPLSRGMEECREGKMRKVVSYRCRTRQGSYLWMEANIGIYHDSATGLPVGFVNVLRDISGRKAAEEEMNRAFQEAENQAKIDGLTGVANRRRLDEVLEHEWRRARREHTELSLLLIDVDQFKPYNDIYGHLRGDACLRLIAETALQIVHRPADLLARFGGEEFAVVLPNTSISGAQEIAEHIREAVERQGVPHAGNQHPVVTVSIGCATRTADQDRDVNTLLEDADSALYCAKRAGRNCVQGASALDSHQRN